MSFFRKTESLNIDPELDIDLRISDRARRLTLKVNFSSGRIELVVPKKASQATVTKFLTANQKWIQDKQGEIPNGLPFKHKTQIPLFGKDTEIFITKDDSRKRTSINLTDTQILVRTNLDDPTPRIQRFLKAEALGIYKNLAELKSNHIGKTVQNISIRDTKSRWGSCSHDGQISLSWRLIFAPYEAMDYVIAHEVAHLEHMDHSSRFWNTCKGLCIDYDIGKRWMKDNGHTLMRYGRS